MKKRNAYFWIFLTSGFALMIGYAGIIAGKILYPESILLGGFDLAFIPFVYFGSFVFLLTLFIWLIHRISRITRENAIQPEAHRRPWFPMVALTIFLCAYFSEDLTGIKNCLLFIPPSDYKGITQLQFEYVGDQIKVGMDKSALTSLESVSSAIKRKDLAIDIEWGILTTKHRGITTSYHFDLSPAGKILNIKKINSTFDIW